MASNIARVDAVRSLGFASISGSYATVGTALSHPAKILRFVNYTNGDMYFSFDGTTDNLFLPSNSFVLFDFTANSDSDGDFRISNRTQLYVRQSSAPTSGAVYIEMIYGQGE